MVSCRVDDTITISILMQYVSWGVRDTFFIGGVSTSQVVVTGDLMDYGSGSTFILPAMVDVALISSEMFMGDSMLAYDYVLGYKHYWISRSW